MKILFLSDLRKKRNTGFEIVYCLKKMGYEVYPVNIKGLMPDFFIKRILESKKPEILFTFKGAGKVKFSKIDYKFKKKILWYPDVDIFKNGEFNETLRDIFEFHDYIFIILKSRVGILRNILKKPNVYWMLQGSRFFEERVDKISPDFKCDIGFIGSLRGGLYSVRRRILAGICEKFGLNHKIKLWGIPPEKGESFYKILKKFHTGKKVFFEDFKKAALGSKVVLDIGSDMAIKEEGALSQKVFMITGCGGFLLMHYIKGIEEFFVPGEEIETYTTEEEAVEKIVHYLGNEDKRRKIAERGRKRVLNEHLYYHRLKKIFEICEI